MIDLYNDDCLNVLKTMDSNSIDSIVTDPPYGLSFMGKKWDYDVPSQAIFEECLRVLKPGGHLLSFSGSRTYHRMAVRVEDAGFEIRDQLMWLYGSGFPKSLNVGKAVDKRGGVSVSWFGEWLRNWRKKNNITQKQVSVLFPSKTGGLTGCVANWELGLNIPTNEQFNLICKTFNLPFENLEEAEREVIGYQARGNAVNTDFMSGGNNITKGTSEWEGWGTALKPAHEPICMARKPISEQTVASNVLKYGTGGINIDESRVHTTEELGREQKEGPMSPKYGFNNNMGNRFQEGNPKGRFPANVIMTHHPDCKCIGTNENYICHDECPIKIMDEQSGILKSGKDKSPTTNKVSGFFGNKNQYYNSDANYGDMGGASRFFYCAKTSKSERNLGLDDKNNHPTVKPIKLMKYLQTLVTPKDGTTLDPFMGSGTSGVSANIADFNFIGIEMNEEYFKIAEERIKASDNMELDDDDKVFIQETPQSSISDWFE